MPQKKHKPDEIVAKLRLVEHVNVRSDGLTVRLRVDGLGGLAREMLSGGIGKAA